MAEINLIKEETIQVDLTNESTINAQVTDINYIPGYKQAEEERRANELGRISNENERIEYYEEVRRDVENGEFDGKNTVYVGETEPTDDFYEVWINPEGTPTVEAENIVMEDGETLQDKYENGELKGPKGETGEVSFDDLEEYATKEYVENEIATFDFIKVVDALPETGLDNRIYFVPKADTQTQDLFDEYVWVNNAWEWVTTKQLEVDLTPYYKKTETYSKTEVNELIPSVVNTKSNSQTDTYSCNYINNRFPIGSVYMTSTNESPSNYLGGTWEMFDKEFAPWGGTPDSVFTPTDNNVVLKGVSLIRQGHNIQLRLQLEINKELSDETHQTLGSLNFETLGITRLYMTIYNQMSYSENLNNGIVCNLMYNTGTLTVTDTFNQQPIPSGSSFYIYFNFESFYSYMLDSSCSKFYWKRTS